MAEVQTINFKDAIPENTNSIWDIPSEAMENGFLTTEEFENVKKSIVEDLGFDPIEACGYHVAVLIYQRSGQLSYVDPVTGEKKESTLVAHHAMTEEDKWINCTGRVIHMGSEAYKSGKFRKDRSFRNFLTYGEFIEACKLISQSSLCPEYYKNNFADLTAIIQLGIEADISPYEALHRISIIDGMPVLLNKVQVNKNIASNVFDLIARNKMKPWCKLGDCVVLPRHEGTMIRYKDKPVMLLPDDRMLAKTPDCSFVTRY